MDGPIAKSVTSAEKVRRLHKTVDAGDTCAILLNADPDSLASAMALKRLLWRRTRKVEIYRINKIERADNLALVKLLKIRNQHIRRLKKSRVTKWALIDSQPDHNEAFSGYPFDIIIDHHPVSENLSADFIDIKEDYGANATIMTEYLKAAKIKPSPRLATALFYAIKADTNNFVRNSASSDMIAFRYLYEHANMNIIKKIESSEITTKTLSEIDTAIHNLTVIRQTALVHLGQVDNPDNIVIVADFFMKLAEATFSVCSGVYDDKLIVCFRSAGFRRNAGKFARERFGDVGRAGGHKNMARAEVPLTNVKEADKKKTVDPARFVRNRVTGKRRVGS